jgi:hypothetical protein
VCDGVQLCTHQHQTCTHRSVDGNIKYKKKLKNTKGKKGKNAAAPADDVRVRALSENKLKAVWYITYGGLLMAVRELLFPHPYQPTPPKRTGKPKCGRHRERLYLCTVPTNKFLCDPQNEKKKLKKTGRRVFSPEVPHTRKGTSLEYECVMVNSEDREGGCAI